MPLPNNGNPISFSQINTELGRAANATISLDTAENGGYGTINQCSFYKPVAANPASTSEWYSYNHTAPCVSYYCSGYSNTSFIEACTGDAGACTPSFIAHDYVIIRFNWPTSSGNDLDIVCGFTNTGVTGVQNNTVGFAQGSNTVPDAAGTISNSYVYWNLDNTGSGVEALSVNFNKLLTDNPGISDNPIRFRVNAWWFSTKLTGDITLEFLAYSGGGPVVGTQFNMIPGSGSTLTDYVKLNINVAVTNSGGGASFANTQTLGYINYNPVTKTATFSSF